MHACDVSLFGTIDRLLRQIVAQHIQRVGLLHAGVALCCRQGVTREPRRVTREPHAEGSGLRIALALVIERIAERAQIDSRRLHIGEPAEEQRHVDLGHMQQPLQLVHQRMIVVAALGQTQLRGNIVPFGIMRGLVMATQTVAQHLHVGEYRQQRVSKSQQPPARHPGLMTKAIATRRCIAGVQHRSGSKSSIQPYGP